MPTLANRNNNPGNLKDVKTGQFRNFSSPQEGYAALLNDLQAKQTGTSTTGVGGSSTLADFAKVYAPDSDKNNPAQYTANLANHMKVRPDSQLKDLDLGKWADAIANAEGYERQALGAFADVEPPTMQQQELVNTAIKNPAEAPKKKGLLGTIGSGVASVAKSIVSPVATLAARPVQLGAELLGASAEDVNRVTKNLTGDIVAPVPENFKDVKKDVGRAAETVAMGLAPVAGGALYGAGSSLEKGNDLLSKETALNTGLGLVGGKVADVATPYIAKGAAAITPKFVKQGIEKVAETAAPITEGIANFANKTEILPKGASKIVNAGAEAVNALPGKAMDVIKGQYGAVPTAMTDKALKAKAEQELSKALGNTGKKSVGVFNKNEGKRLKGLENLFDDSPNLNVFDDAGNKVVYEPTTASAFQHAQALQSAKEQTYGELEKHLIGASKDGVKVQTKETLDALKTISKDVSRSGAARSRAAQLIKEIKALKTPLQVNNYLKDLNTGLAGVAAGSSQNIGRQIEREATVHLNEALDKTVLNTLDDSLPIRQLKDKYSSYKAIEDGMVKLAQKMARKTNGGLGGGINDYINAFNLADAFELFVNPVGAAKAGLRAGVLNKLSKNKDPEMILQNVFKTIETYRNLAKGIKPVGESTASNLGKNAVTAGLLQSVGVGEKQ